MNRRALFSWSFRNGNECNEQWFKKTKKTRVTCSQSLKKMWHVCTVWRSWLDMSWGHHHFNSQAKFGRDQKSLIWIPVGAPQIAFQVVRPSGTNRSLCYQRLGEKTQCGSSLWCSFGSGHWRSASGKLLYFDFPDCHIIFKETML